MNAIDAMALISLSAFYILFVGRTLFLYKKGVKVLTLGKSPKKSFEKMLEFALFPVLIAWSVCVVVAALHVDAPTALSYHLIKAAWMKYAGIAVCFVGLAIFLAALISFGRAWRIGIDEDGSNELITSGIFRYSRNPIFLFMDMYFVGIMLIYPNIVFVIIALSTVAGLHMQILREEKFLLARFGEKYVDYKKKARRYI